ncbi:phospho-N-acetylmuramoyl-pentapeptide-transferase [Pseudoclavibacter chungangensis]|uniref:Phospho-N-acetylmuramoyl-pentapeptide-transferase n=1 Tax=Pseudoclavibacter chungangensis TaxID=587635 RepID=A0A7J5BZM4_9MICO|nr:phospho-N-acetylmuramoyl-pentapeptide-transferase [Pseudoclavibacter chungangensis]KAB1660105.1 phospho-N-acetylmuramoyl-pentapeptide-transferase [Pseudoclavibacter chungangensis]NYJ66790.1 phospho-N-acetylmuramoyl-pentapeptide-transferase [Pseudoclavibacter chungangensis]
MIAILIAGAVGMLFTLFMTPLFIRLFHKLHWGQFIREDGPEGHYSKRGTATMGGIVFTIGSVVGYGASLLIVWDVPTASGLLVLGMMVGLAGIGFIDDFLKVRKQQSLGLGGWSKIAGQVIVASVFAIVGLQFVNSEGVRVISTGISFIRELPFDFLAFGSVMGTILLVIWIVLITTATSNAVNVTDGLDGLATGASIVSIGAFGLIGYWQFNQTCGSERVAESLSDACYHAYAPLDMTIAASAIVGSLIGFLWWNTSPAQIFMGDTGSLGLGGALAAFAIISRTELLLVLIGGLFVITTGSVILQRIYFKLTHGKRIFLMSPLHHHFELKGWAEVTIVVRFWIIAGICAAAGLGLFYLEWWSQV